MKNRDCRRREHGIWKAQPQLDFPSDAGDMLAETVTNCNTQKTAGDELLSALTIMVQPGLRMQRQAMLCMRKSRKTAYHIVSCHQEVDHQAFVPREQVLQSADVTIIDVIIISH